MLSWCYNSNVSIHYVTVKIVPSPSLNKYP